MSRLPDSAWAGPLPVRSSPRQPRAGPRPPGDRFLMFLIWRHIKNIKKNTEEKSEINEKANWDFILRNYLTNYYNKDLVYQNNFVKEPLEMF